MEHRLENDTMRVDVKNRGAELASIVYKPSGREMLWQADDAVWGRHAPLLFPYSGRLYNDTLCVRGKPYPAARHGFARNMRFNTEQAPDGELAFCLESNEETRLRYPYEFELKVQYRLEGSKLYQKVTVYNPETASPQHSGDILPFSVGFHPGFTLPLRDGKKAADYEVAFEVPETPRIVEITDGYVNGKKRIAFQQKDAIPLTDDMFADDSIVLTGLLSKTVTLREKNGTGPFIRVGVEGYKYTLLWSVAQTPPPFICIEPWHTLPDGMHDYGEFTNKPGLQKLAPGERYETTLVMEFGELGQPG